MKVKIITLLFLCIFFANVLEAQWVPGTIAPSGYTQQVPTQQPWTAGTIVPTGYQEYAERHSYNPVYATNLNANPNFDLWEAIRTIDYHRAQDALGRGAQLGATDEYGNNAFHLLAYYCWQWPNYPNRNFIDVYLAMYKLFMQQPHADQYVVAQNSQGKKPIDLWNDAHQYKGIYNNSDVIAMMSQMFSGVRNRSEDFQLRNSPLQHTPYTPSVRKGMYPIV